ncbi:MAG: hypothetical protein DSO09_06070 [Candidatus Methanomethylicota archaeon]|uniref:DUF87 domain-containing protein n=1 Tax=Thermoproteota archaeon TaxID=2056631 RepID=A0A520KEP6_9CREN|nr:MAG: DUF87 domain-containing protein [Candidatus Verstraetearchaeota archaeon]TDA37824.1 MAG: hypothetical protein DSO09_06070 [Candidatus Verstraetearchaeota archaeon]
MSVGKIEGITSTESFTISITNANVGRNDYIEVEHEGKKYLLMIKDVKRCGNKLLGECIVIGQTPKIPFNPGSDVYLASPDTIRKGLGLVTTEEEGLYIGKLKSKDIMVWLPIKKLTRVFIVGKPGAGKSYTMGVIAEELIKKGIPIVIIDAHGEYSSLKIPAEAPSEEFKIEPKSYANSIIEFANLTFNPGADIDISLLDNMKIEDIVSQMQCTIINLRGLPTYEQYSIVGKLLKRLLEAIMIMQIPPFYLVLDEAHIFAGRSKMKDPIVKETVEIVRRFAQEGRKFGANLIVLTQRPQLLDMTVRSLSATWIIHKLTDPNDIRIAIESGGLEKEWSEEISWLEPGEAIITGDIIERIPLYVKIRRRETKHGAPGFNPLDFVSPKERESMKKRLSQLKSKLAKISTVQETTPTLSLPSLYLPIKTDENYLLNILKEDISLDHVEVIKSNLKYMPALFAEASVNTVRKITSLQDRIKRLIPADYSVSVLDWRIESAYNLVVNDIIDMSLLHSPMREGKHVPYSPILQENYGIENLKGTLKTFVIAKLTQNIYYHKELGEYSQPGESIEDFKKRIKEKLDDIKKNKISEITSSYDSKIKELNVSMNSIKDEIESVNKLIKDIENEIEELNKEKYRLEKEGRSTLKISDQIRTRGIRKLRLEKRISELNNELIKIKKEKEILEQKIKEDIKNIENEINSLFDTPLQTIVFQPKSEEVSIDAMHVLWIPMFEAIYRVYFNGVTKDLRFEWNGLNGKGNFGICSHCGTLIDSLNRPLLCYICGEIYCQEHLFTCKTCQRGICNEHAWKCQNCEGLYCIEEKSYLCSVCGKKLCSDCILKCIECKENVYCKDHIKKCEVCNNTFCSMHYNEHLKECSICGKKLCTLEQVECSICGKIFCKDDSIKCPECKKYVCRLHSWQCSACGRLLCIEETKNECIICGKPLCNSCVRLCQICGSSICALHEIICPDCNRVVCQNCIVEKRKFGIFKKHVCKLCAIK